MAIGLLHEIPDQLGMLRSLTKWAARINAPAEAPGLVAEAFAQLCSGRPRPVGLEVPPDILAHAAEVDLLGDRAGLRAPPVDLDAIERAAQLLGAARQPADLRRRRRASDAAPRCGSWPRPCRRRWSRAARAMASPSSRHDAQPARAGGAPALGRGRCRAGDRHAPAAPLLSWGYDDELKVIRIDIDPTETCAAPRRAIGICRRAARTPALLDPRRGAPEPRAPLAPSELAALRAEVARRAAFLEPQLGYPEAIREELPDDGFFVEEMTQVGYVSRFALPVYQPRTFVSARLPGHARLGLCDRAGGQGRQPDRAVALGQRRRRLDVQRPGAGDRRAAQHRRRHARLQRRRLWECAPHAEESATATG